MDAPEITVEILRTEDLAPEVRAAIIDLCIAAFGDEDFRRLFHFVPHGGAALRRLGRR